MAQKAKKEVKVKVKKTETSVTVKVEREITQDLLDSAAQEINAAVIEFAYVSNIAKVQMFWEVGRILRDAELRYKVNISELVAAAAHHNEVKEVHMGERNLWFAIKVADSFPAVDFKKAEEALPDGKATSITKLKKLLVTPDPKKIPTMEEVAAAIFRKYELEECKIITKTLQSLIKRGAKKE